MLFQGHYFVGLLLPFFFSWTSGAPTENEVTYLPGWSPKPLPSKQYSGFVDSSSDGSMQMHYWLAECEEDPADAPLLLWFNGGPGASSLYGFLVELGPFLLSDLSYESEEYKKTGIPQLIYNTNGWQKKANILALSIPPPVGFSYCNPPGPTAQGQDCGSWNDTSTAEATYYALRSFLLEFPEYKSNNMYIAGESYAGVYVPMLVKQILAHPEDEMNLKGFAVGDACTPPEICGTKHYGPYYNIEFLYGKNAFSNKLYEEIQAVCDQEELMNGNMSEECSAVVAKIDGEVGAYWIYGFYDDCYYENDIRRSRSLTSVVAGDRKPYFGPPIGLPGGKRKDTGASTSTIPNGYACGGPAAQVEWLSLDVVKTALHVPVEANFFQCDNGDDFLYNLTETDLISWYKEIIATNSLRILVYNGDTDPCINAYQAQNWTRNLGFSEVESWRPWTTDGCQRMGGYVTRYENNFDFLTIKGSGHMVPEMKPETSLEFITRFMSDDYHYQNYDAACTSPPASDASAADGTAILTEEDIVVMMKEETRQYEKKEAELLSLLENLQQKE